jgi:hypothetical protein
MATTSKTSTKTRRSGKAAIRHRNRSNVIPAAPYVTKAEHTIGMLRRKDGASLSEIMDALGWQEHSVRALLSATIAKKMNLPLIKGKAPGEATRYYIAPIRPSKD